MSAFARRSALPALLLCLLCACSPKLNWREVHGKDAPFTVLLPGKPSNYARTMELHGIKMTMQMTAAEVDGTTFAVGSAKLADAAQATAALEEMQRGMLDNIRAQPEAINEVPGGRQIVARGHMPNGETVKLAARFIVHGAWAYQALILGPEKMLTRDTIAMFMASFKPE